MLKKLGIVLAFAAAMALVGCAANSRMMAKKRTKGTTTQQAPEVPAYTGPQQATPAPAPAPVETQPAPTR